MNMTLATHTIVKVTQISVLLRENTRPHLLTLPTTQKTNVKITTPVCCYLEFGPPKQAIQQQGPLERRFLFLDSGVVFLSDPEKKDDLRKASVFRVLAFDTLQFCDTIFC